MRLIQSHTESFWAPVAPLRLTCPSLIDTSCPLPCFVLLSLAVKINISLLYLAYFLHASLWCNLHTGRDVICFVHDCILSAYNSNIICSLMNVTSPLNGLSQIQKSMEGATPEYPPVSVTGPNRVQLLSGCQPKDKVILWEGNLSRASKQETHWGSLLEQCVFESKGLD